MNIIKEAEDENRDTFINKGPTKIEKNKSEFLPPVNNLIKITDDSKWDSSAFVDLQHDITQVYEASQLN